MTLVSVIVQQNIDVAAKDYGDPNIDHGYIYNKTESLSKIISVPGCWNTSRYFGTKGEQEAADRIQEWMENISLDCVKKEKINAYWTKKNEKVLLPKDSLYLGSLCKSREMQDFYLNITVYNTTDNWSIVEYKNLSWTRCFPYFLRGYIWVKESSGNNLTVYEDFNKSDSNNQMELGNISWTKGIYGLSSILKQALYSRYMGYILVDTISNAHFNNPPNYDHLKWQSLFEKQGFYVNGSIGT